VSQIEHGKANPTLEVVWRIAAAFYVHWADLLDDRAPGELPEHVPVPFEQQLATFGLRAYQARKLQRLSQQAVADSSGIGRSTIAALENGLHNISVDILSRLAAALHVHPAVLLDDRDPNPPRPTHGVY
jgi:transcriptional regulator with XRE-family HTH domain